MTLAQTDTRARRRYHRDVERLLEQIQWQVQELRQLKVVGASSRALAERKHRLERTRGELADLVSAGTPSRPRTLAHR